MTGVTSSTLSQSHMENIYTAKTMRQAHRTDSYRAKSRYLTEFTQTGIVLQELGQTQVRRTGSQGLKVDVMNAAH